MNTATENTVATPAPIQVQEHQEARPAESKEQQALPEVKKKVKSAFMVQLNKLAMTAFNIDKSVTGNDAAAKPESTLVRSGTVFKKPAAAKNQFKKRASIFVHDTTKVQEPQQVAVEEQPVAELESAPVEPVVQEQAPAQLNHEQSDVSLVVVESIALATEDAVSQQQLSKARKSLKSIGSFIKRKSSQSLAPVKSAAADIIELLQKQFRKFLKMIKNLPKKLSFVIIDLLVKFQLKQLESAPKDHDTMVKVATLKVRSLRIDDDDEDEDEKDTSEQDAMKLNKLGFLLGKHGEIVGHKYLGMATE